MKKLLSLLVAVLLVLMSTVYAFATETEDALVSAEPDVQLLDETITLKDNQVMINTYNLTEDHEWGVRLMNNSGGASIIRMFRDCIDESQLINTEKDARYEFCVCYDSGYGGGLTTRFDKTGGEYIKVRAKLSALSDYFNEDGSHTQRDHTYYFGDPEHVGNNEYSAVLVIESGGVITGVAPDKDGFVEFYISTDINTPTSYATSFAWRVGGSLGSGGGVSATNFKKFLIGNVDGTSGVGIYIKDATDVQMYVTKMKDFDQWQKFRADVDRNGDINIMDATKIQMYVAGYSY